VALRRPRYTGPPAPSPEMISGLYNELGAIGRSKRMAEADYNRGRSGLYSARKLFLGQLGDTYRTQGYRTASDFASRGLSQSGLYTEAQAQNAKAMAGEQAGYQAEFQGGLDEILARLTAQRSELAGRRRTINERYQQARSDRARILRLMGA
jgi:hypothetical protein